MKNRPSGKRRLGCCPPTPERRQTERRVPDAECSRHRRSRDQPEHPRPTGGFGRGRDPGQDLRQPAGGARLGRDDEPRPGDHRLQDAGHGRRRLHPRVPRLAGRPRHPGGGGHGLRGAQLLLPGARRRRHRLSAEPGRPRRVPRPRAQPPDAAQAAEAARAAHPRAAPRAGVEQRAARGRAARQRAAPAPADRHRAGDHLRGRRPRPPDPDQQRSPAALRHRGGDRDRPHAQAGLRRGVRDPPVGAQREGVRDRRDPAELRAGGDQPAAPARSASC